MSILLQWIKDRYKEVHSDHQAIATGIVWVTLFVFIGKLAGAAKEMVVAWRYGVGAEVDAYLFLYNLVTWPIGVWFSILTVVLVPLAAKIRQNDTQEIANFRAELLGGTLLLGLVLAVLSWLGLFFLLRSSLTGLPPSTARLAESIVAPMALLAPLGVLASLFSAWMLAAGRHTNTLLEGIPALVTGLAVLMFVTGNVEPLIWGTVAGFCCHLVSLAIPLRRRQEINAPRFSMNSHQWRFFWQGFGIMFMGQALISLVSIVDQFYAARLSEGAIATLGYANRILALVLSLGATAVSRATLPVFSRIVAQSGQQVHCVAGKWTKLLFGLGIVGAIIGWWLAPWAVKLLFERGAFTVKNTMAVTGVLRYGLLQLPFYFSTIVMVSVISSGQRYVLLLWSGLIAIVVKIAANAILVPMLGVNGLTAAWAFVYAANLIFFLKVQPNE